jgi:heme/copper-type cytochrome/quinol oxidase subunit 1
MHILGITGLPRRVPDYPTLYYHQVAQGNYVTGQYSLAASAPAGGTWTSRYTIVDTQVDETKQTMYIWQKTAATTAAVDNYKPCKLDGTSVKEMSVAEIEQIVPNMRNRKRNN